MARLTSWSVVGAVVSVAWGCSAHGQRILEVENEIIEKASKTQSFIAKVTTHTKIENEYFHDSTSEATLELSRLGDKVLFRNEGKVTGKYMPPERAERILDRDTLSVCDGVNLYQYVDQSRERWPDKRAIRMDAGSEPALFPDRKFFDYLRTDHDLDLLPDEKVEGQSAYVIVATPNDPARFNIKRKLTYFSKETGLILKQVIYDIKDNPYNTMTIRDIKTNVKIDPQRFVFKAPEGVQIQDLAAMTSPASPAKKVEPTGAGGDRPKPTTVEKPKEPATQEEKPATEPSQPK